MTVGILFDVHILKILREAKTPLTRNAIKASLDQQFKTSFSWHTVNDRIIILRKQNKIEEILSGKMKLYKTKSH